MSCLVGCDRKIRYFKKNSKRHIKEHHGELLPNGQWVLKRYQCEACSKQKKRKMAKREDNLDAHYESAHPKLRLRTIQVLIPISPLKFKSNSNEHPSDTTEELID